MRKIFFTLTLLLFTLRIFGQAIPNTEFSKDYYLQKSKNKKTTGWILLASGAVMTVVGVVGFSNSDFLDDSSDRYGYLMLGGPVISLGSIPFFISYGNNARKAATLAVTNQPIYIPRQGSLVLNSQPSLSFKINF
ncbi:hypothetical protein [Flavobacterium psychrotolerans]|uniref:Uncharacterized protein n=1 Tax=Flavobacterium psychrotolerans TaxID=2169410 RepID=A0A2U1JQV1_9FLAO|nr:hypothetical protein [Flavobacterium psychrotolerans]PWA07395.1 hypothetical protein DB895_01365 [Flavobacterium psychrotolerans]